MNNSHDPGASDRIDGSPDFDNFHGPGTSEKPGGSSGSNGSPGFGDPSSGGTQRSRTFQVALGGICLALTVGFLFAGTIVPGIDLTLFALASLFTAVMVIETGIGGGILLFTAACLLGFFLIPGKLAILPYVCLFGYWPVLKYFLEKISAPAVQIACKCAIFACILGIAFFAFRDLLASSLDLPDYPALVLLVAGVLILLLYDYVITCLINWYYRRIRRQGEDRLKLS